MSVREYTETESFLCPKELTRINLKCLTSTFCGGGVKLQEVGMTEVILISFYTASVSFIEDNHSDNLTYNPEPGQVSPKPCQSCQKVLQ